MPDDRFDRLREALQARMGRFKARGQLAKAAVIDSALALMREIDKSTTLDADDLDHDTGDAPQG